MNDKSLRLLACQINIPEMSTSSERNAHLSHCAGVVSQALDIQPADLVVLPELSSIDYSRPAFECLDALAEPTDGPSFKTWSVLAQKYKTHIAYGFARRGHDGFYISTGVVGPHGSLLGYYDKLHLCQYGASMEKDYFTRGNHLFTFHVNGIKCAPIICYDIRIPELSRTLVLDHGVDLILHSGAYYRDESFATWHNFTTTRAMENQIYLLSLNRAGGSYGGSAMCYPWMDENTPRSQFSEHDEELRYFEVNSNKINEVRDSYSFLRDRLGDYSSL